MTDDLNIALLRAIDNRDVERIKATIVPSSPRAKVYVGNHLLVNCLYRSVAFHSTPANALAAARDDTVAILRCLVNEHAMKDIISVCVTLSGTLGGDWLVAPVRGRIYRYSILCSALNVAPERINPEFLLSNRLFLQTSEVSEIEQAMAAEPPRDSDLCTDIWEQ